MAELYRRRVAGKTTLHYEYEPDPQATQAADNWRKLMEVVTAWGLTAADVRNLWAAGSNKKRLPEGDIFRVIADALGEEAGNG